MAVNDSLIVAKVMHHRLTPKKNKFMYSQYYVFIKATQTWTSKLKLLSINTFNLFSIFFKKYGKFDGNNPYDYVLSILKERCEDTTWLKDILLLTQPSLLGWAFNPISFWFFIDKDDTIRAVLCEVNNTFGEHHKYFAFNQDFSPISPSQHLTSDKLLYVSPFYEVTGEYTFRFHLQEETIGVWIDYFQKGEKTLSTSLTGHFKKMDDTNLLRLFFMIPFSNIKTVLLIHWQALKLWVRGIKYINREKHDNTDITRCR